MPSGASVFHTPRWGGDALAPRRGSLRHPHHAMRTHAPKTANMAWPRCHTIGAGDTNAPVHYGMTRIIQKTIYIINVASRLGASKHIVPIRKSGDALVEVVVVPVELIR